MKYQFPENFWWGSAASGPQTEGVLKVMVKVKTFGILVSRSARKILSTSRSR